MKTSDKALGYRMSSSVRLLNQVGNSLSRGIVNGVFAERNGGSFRKSFFNSLFWESVEFAGEFTLSNYNHFGQDGLNNSDPTFQKGEGSEVYATDDHLPWSPGHSHAGTDVSLNLEKMVLSLSSNACDLILPKSSAFSNRRLVNETY